MKTPGLQHRHGGKIVEVFELAHETFERVASWHCVARVEWDNGTVSERAIVPLHLFSFDTSNEKARAAYTRISYLMDEYLREQGEWLPKSRQVGGHIVWWIAKTKDGQRDITSIEVTS